jgi:hypothetical protein
MGSLGTRLKQHREQRKITLDDISASTKISTRLLRAIEDEHFDQLPGGIFNKGFIRAYARQVGMSEDEAVTAYLEASGQVEVQKDAPAQQFPLQIAREKLKPPSATAADIPWSMLALALIVLAIAFASWNFYVRQKNALPHPEAAALSPLSGGQKSTPELVSSREPSPAPPSMMPAASPVAAVSFTVLIKAQQDCWVLIKTDGKPGGQEMLSAGAQRAVTGTRQIEVRAGNIGALDFSFNGHKLPAQGDYGEVKTLSFGPDGLDVSTTNSASAPAQP